MGIDVLRDPEGAELGHLLAACQLSGRDVIEIGSGNGRLTWRYASLPHLVICIDPQESNLHEAKSHTQAPLSNVCFTQAIGEALPFHSQAFSIAIFAWSL